MTGERIPELERVGQTSRTSIGGNQKGKRGKDMKTFKKVLASALAAAMVVTAFPVANAEAASTAKLSATKATLYVGQSKTLKVTTPKTWKSVKVKATSSKKSVASVKKSGKKVTVKAVKAGTAKVTVKVTAKKGKKAVKKTLTFKATVKNPTLTVKAAATELAVGETTTITAKATPKKTVSFKSSDETIATVDATGAVKAVKAGTVKITATAGKLTKDVELTIKNVIFKDVKQTKVNELTATIAGDTASVKADGVAIKNTTNNIVYAVKSVSVDKADKTKVTITTFADMKDGKEYSVTIADTTKTFTATDNKIVAVNVTPATVPYATLTTVSAIAVDTQGVELGSANLGDATLAGKTIEFTVTPAAGGYTSAAQLYLAKKGDTAKAKVTIKSGEYDATGKEINNIDSGDVTITAVDQEVVAVNGFKARVSTENKSFDEVKDATSLAIGDQGYAFFKFTNSKGDEIAAADYANYKVESSNANVLVVNETALSTVSGKKGSAAVNVYGVAAGTAYLIVKDTKNKDAIVATIAVTVNAKRVVDSLALDKTYLVLSTNTAVGVETVNVTVKDQYGDKMTSDYTMTCELLASPSGATAASAPTVDATTAITSVKFTTATPGAKTGTYTYKVTVKSADGKIERSQVVKVDVKAPTGTVAYAFEISGLDANNTVDATLNDKFAGNKDVVIKIVKTEGGVKSAYVDADNVVVKKDNKAVTVTTAASAQTATFAAIATNAGIATAAAAGTYVVSASVNGVNVAPVTFIVKNDTAKVTASQAKDTVVAGTLESTLGASFDFYFGAKKLDASMSEYAIASVKATKNGLKGEVNAAVNAGDIVNVTEVVLSVKFDGTNSFYVTVPVNKTVKVVA